MKLNFAKRCLVAAAAGVLSFSAVAQDDKAKSLDQLLNMVKDNKILESKEHKQREARFRSNKNEQARLLREEQEEKARLERRSDELEKLYQKQEQEIAEKRQQRQQALGTLNELFGHLTTTANDLRGNIETSLVSAQIQGRAEFLDELIDKMNSATKLPKIEEIERLWEMQLKEMVEGSKVVKFTDTVIKPDGQNANQEVVRIGLYNLVSEGQYLTFDDKLEELARQPGGFESGALALQNATEGFTAVGIDPTGPTGGTFLKALIDSPNLEERWHQGGYVGYVITGVGVFGLLLGLWRIIVLSGISSKVSSQLKSKKANTNNPLGRVLKVSEDNPGIDNESLELKLEEAVLKERPAIESGLALLKIIAAVAPLLGLLGTVVGMIQTFQAITIFGAGDPKAMAGGISGALVTTVLGLIVAIPTVLMHTFVNSKAKRIIHVLDEQSAGIIAENAESK